VSLHHSEDGETKDFETKLTVPNIILILSDINMFVKQI